MIFGSVCSGIEAASVAWNPLQFKAAWFAEIESFPGAVLAHHYPEVPNLGDMTTIAASIRAGDVVAPDVLVGGTPCQAFSVAGLRGGLTDARGQLSLSYVELANEIDHTRARNGKSPCITVWENVPGVLSSKDNAFGCFLAGLAGEDRPLQPSGRKWSNAGCVYGPRRTVAWRILDAQYFGLAQRRKRVFVVASADPRINPAEILFDREGVRRDSAPRRRQGQSVAGTLSACSFVGGAGGRPEGAAAGHYQPVAFGGGNTRGEIDVAACLTAKGVRLDFEVETFALSIDFRGREGGNTAELGADISGCMRASGGDSDKPHVLYHSQGRARLAVRRLMPVECERLQGFPDNYTLVPFTRSRKPAKDAPRYKALGNSMAVPVMAWLGQRIQNAVRAANVANDANARAAA